MAEIWPVTVPDELSVEGYGEGLADNLVRTDTSSGPEKRRPRSSISERQIQGKIVMTSAEYDDLITFYIDTLGHGALTFNFLDPRDRSTTLTVVFINPPTTDSPGGDNYEVSINLATRP